MGLTEGEFSSMTDTGVNTLFSLIKAVPGIRKMLPAWLRNEIGIVESILNRIPVGQKLDFIWFMSEPQLMRPIQGKIINALVPFDDRFEVNSAEEWVRKSNATVPATTKTFFSRRVGLLAVLGTVLVTAGIVLSYVGPHRVAQRGRQVEPAPVPDKSE